MARRPVKGVGHERYEGEQGRDEDHRAEIADLERPDADLPRTEPEPDDEHGSEGGYGRALQEDDDGEGRPLDEAGVGHERGDDQSAARKARA